MITLKTGPGSTAVVHDLVQQGYGPSTSFNDSVPRLPQDLTEVSDQDLMSLFQSFVEYNNFMLLQLSCARVDEETSLKSLEKAQAKILVEAPKGETVAKTKAKMVLDTGLELMDSDYQVRHNYHEILKSMQAGVSESTKVVSREITRRTSGSFNSKQRMMT
jgi:hypothetical protein